MAKEEAVPPQGFPGAPSPFYANPDGMTMQQMLGTGAGQPLAGTVGVAGSGTFDPAYFSAYSSGGSSGGMAGTYTLSLQEQQALASGQLPSLGGQPLAYVEVGSAGGLPIIAPQFAAGPQLGVQQQQQPQPALSAPSGGGAVSQPSGGGGAAARSAKPRPKRPYKPPHQVAQERKLKDEANDYIRRLEQQLGKARSELERLQRDNKTLQRKAVVLSKHSSFRRCAAGMVQELQQSMTVGAQLQGMDSSQRVLDAAEKGLPEPRVLEVLRSMTLEQAVQQYNGVVARVRELLLQLEHGPNSKEAVAALDDIFALRDKGSTFGYLQVVNPTVYAELMQAKLDPASPVDRDDPAHWRAVLAAMCLSEEQESQLILLLQSHLQQTQQIVQLKSKVMAQLAEELTNDLLSLELSTDGSASDLAPDLAAEDGGGGGGGGGAPGGAPPARQPSGNARAQQACRGLPRPLHAAPAPLLQPPRSRHLAPTTSLSPTDPPPPPQAKDELDRLVRLEYWLKFDFTGCVRKLLPAQQQALCMVRSWPYYPDHKQVEAAVREKAGPLWDQLARSAS